MSCFYPLGLGDSVISQARSF